MKTQIRILYLEDDSADALRFDCELQQGGLDFCSQRVDAKEDFLHELEPPPDVILSDHGLPSFDGLTAMSIAQEKCPDVPFIFVTNALTETEIDRLSNNVVDCVLKSELDYLPIAVRHALHQAEERRWHKALPEFLAKTKLWDRQVPICSCCKKIRDEQKIWQPPELFFRQHLKINFTYDLCPDCKLVSHREIK